MTDQPTQEQVSFGRFQQIIAQELQVDQSKVVREASFTEDLCADSIQLVNLMLRLEEMGITIPIEAAWEVETVGDAYAVYRRHVAP
ncbi:MAG: acyl carrier protein [Anaerolineae bacterium]|nr:acyl carrier protein [Anaerolineae bacterium]